MAGSILKEVTFTPYAFEEKFNLLNNKRFRKLITILENLQTSGIIVTASNTWREEVFQFLKSYEDDDAKDEIIAFLEHMDSIGILQNYPSLEKYSSEQEWVEKIDYLNQQRPFDFVAGTINTEIVKTTENIDSNLYQNTGGEIEKQTVAYMKKMLAPLLSYAEIAKIIDPYFDLSKRRFASALDIICGQLGNTHGKHINSIIEIHTSIKVAAKYNTSELDTKKLTSWNYKIKEFEEKYGHTITLKIWEEIKGKNEWHERCIITNFCGIFIGKGTDVSEFMESTWGLLNRDRLPEISNRFNESRKYYRYLGKVSSEGFEEAEKSTKDILPKPAPKRTGVHRTLRKNPFVIRRKS